MEDGSLGAVSCKMSNCASLQGPLCSQDSFLKVWVPQLSLLYHEYLLSASYLAFCFVLPWEQSSNF